GRDPHHPRRPGRRIRHRHRCGRRREHRHRRAGGAGMSAALTGTQGEDRSNYTREESRAIRRRSLRLLGSLVAPLKARIVLAAVVLVVSTALQVSGPILISIGLDRALPAVLEQANWMPTFAIGIVYLLAGATAAALIGW